MSACSCLTKAVRDHYLHRLRLPEGAGCQVTYVWISSSEQTLRSKTRTLSEEPRKLEDVPVWFATQMINRDAIETQLFPVRMFRDPFTLDPNKLVLCEMLDAKRDPAGGNLRSHCAQLMAAAAASRPWFGMEQEFVLMGLDGRPLGWPPQGCSSPLGSCRVGADRVFGRDVCLSHYRACLYAGVNICGANAESVPSQWEFQVGPCEGIEAGDHLWMARYILHRVCEDFGVVASLAVKPIEGHVATSGCHTNFSTEQMRSEGGLQHIEDAIESLRKRHAQHLRVYDPHGGEDNQRRLTSERCCTSSFHDFSAATGSRRVSVRVPEHVSCGGCGYLEDRRPASNCDPYAVTAALVETCLLARSRARKS